MTILLFLINILLQK